MCLDIPIDCISRGDLHYICHSAKGPCELSNVMKETKLYGRMFRTENTDEHITDDFHWDYSFISTPTTLQGNC
jgi:hypothetical protein